MGKFKASAVLSVILSAVFLFSTSLFSPKTALASPPHEKPAGRVARVEGRVDILRADARTATPLKLGDEVFAGDIVRTKSDGKVELAMIDGSVLRLGNDSRLGIEHYQYKPGSSRRAAVKLYRGKAGFRVPHYAIQNSFHLKTRTAVAGIRGTGGWLVSEEVEAVYVTKGLVRFSNKFGAVMVRAGEVGAFMPGQGPTVGAFSPAEIEQLREGTAFPVKKGPGNGKDNGKTPGGTHSSVIKPTPSPMGGAASASTMTTVLPGVQQPANNVMAPPATGVGGLPTSKQISPMTSTTTSTSTPVNINVNVP